jgi:NADPH:quinone reductase-like Zn-dependent oxidoreductase
MRAIVIQEYGGPEKLAIQELSDPQPQPGQVAIQVQAFGVNHAETHMRKGEWPEAAKVSGIECVGLVTADPGGHFRRGQKVAALMGGMGRTINGSYAEQTCVPATNVTPIESQLSWAELAAIPESYATAWTCLHRNLELSAGEVLVIRGATSALGQAALNIAAHAGARVIATTRKPERFLKLEELGAALALLDAPDLSRRVREIHSGGVDCVLDLVGNRTVLDSLAMVRRGGRVCEAGWLGGLAPIASFNPMLQMPSGVHFSLFGSFMFGAPEFPLTDVPLQTIVDRAASGAYNAKPARVFRFEEIQDAHRLMDSGGAGGKIVVTL